MEFYSNKVEQAIEACDKVINGIEDGTISTSSSLLLCKKIARLVNDYDGIKWLDFEYGGYPLDNDGYIMKEAWNIATMHGRDYKVKDENGEIKNYIFTELSSELETIIESNKIAIGNFSTQGFSVSGDAALLATSRLTNSISENTGAMLQNIKKAERRLSILKSQYYDYAVKWLIDLKFGNLAQNIFEEYKERVSGLYSDLQSTILQKLNAIEELIMIDNPEHYSQVLTTCRRLWKEIADSIFDSVFSNYPEKVFKSKTGKEIDVSGDHYNNKLSAVIEIMQSKATNNSLVGTEIIYLIDWLEQINKKQSVGVHSEVTREQAIQCIIHTYIALGDILSLKNDFDKV